MKFKFLFLIIMVSTVGLNGCITKNMILPGDKIGEMIVSNDMEIDVPNFSDICPFPELMSGNCEISSTVGKFGVSTA